MGNHSVRKIHFKCTPLAKTKKNIFVRAFFSPIQTRENSCSTKLLAAMSCRSVFWQLNIIHFVHKFVISKWNRIQNENFSPDSDRFSWKNFKNESTEIQRHIQHAHHHRRQHLTIDFRSGFESEFASRNLFSIHNIFSQQKFRQDLAFLADMYFVFNFEMDPSQSRTNVKSSSYNFTEFIPMDIFCCKKCGKSLLFSSLQSKIQFYNLFKFLCSLMLFTGPSTFPLVKKFYRVWYSVS